MTEKKGVELDDDDPLNDPPNVVRLRPKPKPRRKLAHLGGPFELLADVWRLTRSRTAQVVMACICRRVKVCNAETVTLSGKELAKLGINRQVRSRNLARLQKVGLIRIEGGRSPNSALQVTVTWRYSIL